ncbi:hypothetical protein EV363DRAFT_1340713 [Boletus edulis]|nr:hypothetical protein EV363DRAFT_1340713 [Boletus edulis]
MSCSIHARFCFFLVALFFLSFRAVVFEFLLNGELSSTGKFTSHILRRTSPHPIDVPNGDGPVDTVNYASILLRVIRACLDAPHSREWIVKGVLRWLSFCQWAVVGMIALRFHHVEQPKLGLFVVAQHLSCFAARLLCGASSSPWVVLFSSKLIPMSRYSVWILSYTATRARIASLVPASFMPRVPPVVQVVPPRLLVAVSSAGMSPIRESQFRSHARSLSRVAEIAM